MVGLSVFEARAVFICHLRWICLYVSEDKPRQHIEKIYALKKVTIRNF